MYGHSTIHIYIDVNTLIDTHAYTSCQTSCAPVKLARLQLAFVDSFLQLLVHEVHVLLPEVQGVPGDRQAQQVRHCNPTPPHPSPDNPIRHQKETGLPKRRRERGGAHGGSARLRGAAPSLCCLRKRRKRSQCPLRANWRKRGGRVEITLKIGWVLWGR